MCDGMQVVTGLVLAILGVCKEDTGIFTVCPPPAFFFSITLKPRVE